MNFELISLLADGGFHSGVELGKKLGITRAAVWKNISQLEDFGLLPEKVKGVGYRLSEPLSLLSATKISQLLNARSKLLIEHLRLESSLASTNDDVKAFMKSYRGYTVSLAEHQSLGRGRRGKYWTSPYGKNLYMSFGSLFEKGFEALNGLSLAVGVAVARSIAELGLDVRLKWPNDVWIKGKKVAGILVEVDGEQGGPLNLVIGIGVNINMRGNETEIDQPWTSLASELNRLVDRTAFTASLIDNLLSVTELFRQQGFTCVKEEWHEYDGIRGKHVMLSGQERAEYGVCRGVDDRGYLLLESGGMTKAFSAGELSLRLAI